MEEELRETVEAMNENSEIRRRGRLLAIWLNLLGLATAALDWPFVVGFRSDLISKQLFLV